MARPMAPSYQWEAQAQATPTFMTTRGSSPRTVAARFGCSIAQRVARPGPPRSSHWRNRRWRTVSAQSCEKFTARRLLMGDD